MPSDHIELLWIQQKDEVRRRKLEWCATAVSWRPSPFFFLPLLPQTVLAEPVETLWLGVGEHKATSQAIFGLDEADLLSILRLQPCRWHSRALQRLHQRLKLW